ncbi:MAG: prepilin-type N-terminal cleavage/methylation domain-containing protein, partial [Candidatus Sumerlaeota bacterium]
MRLSYRKEHKVNPRAFTLIELLIVVAIIAILAAIAVPNFLEAQVRAKISRCKADLRTVATGLETYYVDHNRYPYASAINTTGTFEQINSEMAPTHKFLSSVITSPISYLNDIPKDVFATGFDHSELRHFYYAPLALEKSRQGQAGFPADHQYWPGPPNHTDP